MKSAKSLVLGVGLLSLVSVPALASRVEVFANVSSTPNQSAVPTTLTLVMDNSRGTPRGIFAFNFPGTDCMSNGAPLNFALTQELNETGVPTGAYLVDAGFAITCTMDGAASPGQVQFTGIKISANSKLVSAPISIQLESGASAESVLYPVTPRIRVIP